MGIPYSSENFGTIPLHWTSGEGKQKRGNLIPQQPLHTSSCPKPPGKSRTGRRERNKISRLFFQQKSWNLEKPFLVKDKLCSRKYTFWCMHCAVSAQRITIFQDRDACDKYGATIQQASLGNGRLSGSTATTSACIAQQQDKENFFPFLGEKMRGFFSAAVNDPFSHSVFSSLSPLAAKLHPLSSHTAMIFWTGIWRIHSF